MYVYGTNWNLIQHLKSLYSCLIACFNTKKSLNTNNSIQHTIHVQVLTFKLKKNLGINIMTQGMAHLQQVRLGIKFGESDCKSKHPSR